MGSTAYDWPRTLMARGAEAQLRPEHLRRRPQEARSGALHCFLLDCSASMLKDGKLARAKGVLVALMEEAYRRRDSVALLCFGGNTVELRMPPRRAGAFNDAWLAPIAGGGGTPLTLGVQQAGILLAKHEAAQRWLWLLTDGRSAESPARPAGVDVAMVVDLEGGRGTLRRAEELALDWDAEYTTLHRVDGTWR
ncbi:VWA domain-containing protein [Variovorax sp. UMC13]|uniref:vWA domain-containing protein n=1 Tax=Variovorax sp. UMC13 TaxID=1862326 RepID=UPI0015FFF22B|nr:VWA domain-containing protein [Variovorax sp. UMC13]MBB1602293.1 von willebrand factor type a [Variovorax sp. UMC13]